MSVLDRHCGKIFLVLFLIIAVPPFGFSLGSILLAYYWALLPARAKLTRWVGWWRERRRERQHERERRTDEEHRRRKELLAFEAKEKDRLAKLPKPHRSKEEQVREVQSQLITDVQSLINSNTTSNIFTDEELGLIVKGLKADASKKILQIMRD